MQSDLKKLYFRNSTVLLGIKSRYKKGTFQIPVSVITFHTIHIDKPYANMFCNKSIILVICYRGFFNGPVQHIV